MHYRYYSACSLIPVNVGRAVPAINSGPCYRRAQPALQRILQPVPEELPTTKIDSFVSMEYSKPMDSISAENSICNSAESCAILFLCISFLFFN